MIFVTYFLLINLISFIVMYVDKRKAIKHKWRISESTLFLLSIFGGSLGILLAMYTFHHKTKHPNFKIGIPAILIFQVFILLFIYKK